ncbi:MAG: DMT family transporter, partial [candidate division Zixibacteria bacterium]|nr:DMT family transporter [candidate division Zixibacteria bacterium]
ITAAAAVSPAAIFIILADAPPMTVAFYRLFFASLILLPIYLYHVFSKKISSISKRDFLLTVISGLFLTAHFATWIKSLFYTTVSNSVILVTTTPIFVAIFAWIFLGEKMRLLGVSGILIAITGSIVITGGDFSMNPDYLYGDILALIGAVMAGAYFTIGRQVRKSVQLLTYIFYCYTISALGLLIVVIMFNEPLIGLSSKSYFYFFLLGLIPTVFGHSLYNWALKHLKAFLVGVCVLGEPLGATLLAWIVLAQTPLSFFYIGAGLIGIGVLILFSVEKTETKALR